MTVSIPSEKIVRLLIRNRERSVAEYPSRRMPWPKLDLSADRIARVSTGMATQAVTDILADMLLGRIEEVETVSDLLRIAEARLQRRVDEQ